MASGRPSADRPARPWLPNEVRVFGVYARERKPRAADSANRARRARTSYDVRYRVDGFFFRRGFDKKTWADEFANHLREGDVKGWLFDPSSRRFLPPEAQPDDGPTFVEHAGDHYRRKWPTWAPSRRRDAQWALARACIHLVEPQAPALTGAERVEADRYLRQAVLVLEPPADLAPEHRAWSAWFAKWSLMLKAIDDGHLHAFLEAARTTALDGSPRLLAPNSVATIRSIVRSAFTAALKRRLIDWDPWLAVEWKAPQDEDQVDPDLVMSPQQVLALARACGARHRRYEAYVLVQGFCGLRPGEARELRRCDFDLDASPAMVTATGNYTDVAARYLDAGESRERPLKGRGSKVRRRVPVPEQLVPVFKDHLKEHAASHPDALVFTTPTGKRINPRNFVREVWTRACATVFEESSPLRRVRRHDLRHSAITHWLNSGVLPKTAQKWSGHRRLSVLLDVYVGVMHEDAAASLARVEESLGNVLAGSESWQADGNRDGK